MHADTFTTDFSKRCIDSLGSIMSMMCEIVFIVTVAILSDKKRFRDFDYAIIILWFFPILGFIDVTFALQAPDEVSQINLIAGSMQLLMSSLICKLIVRFIHLTEDVVSREKEASKLENMRDLNKQYYETVQSDIAYVQKFRHDIANYIEQVEVMRMKDDQESRRITDEMVESLKNKANEIRSKRYCDHQFVNMILTPKAEKSKNLGIEYTVKANVPADIKIEPLENKAVFIVGADEAAVVAAPLRLLGRVLPSFEFLRLLRAAGDDFLRPRFRDAVDAHHHFDLDLREEVVCRLLHAAAALADWHLLLVRKFTEELFSGHQFVIVVHFSFLLFSVLEFQDARPSTFATSNNCTNGTSLLA